MRTAVLKISGLVIASFSLLALVVACGGGGGGSTPVGNSGTSVVGQTDITTNTTNSGANIPTVTIQSLSVSRVVIGDVRIGEATPGGAVDVTGTVVVSYTPFVAATATFSATCGGSQFLPLNQDSAASAPGTVSLEHDAWSADSDCTAVVTVSAAKYQSGHMTVTFHTKKATLNYTDVLLVRRPGVINVLYGVDPTKRGEAVFIPLKNQTGHPFFYSAGIRLPPRPDCLVQVVALDNTTFEVLRMLLNPKTLTLTLDPTHDQDALDRLTEYTYIHRIDHSMYPGIQDIAITAAGSVYVKDYDSANLWWQATGADPVRLTDFTYEKYGSMQTVWALNCQAKP